MDVLAKVRNTVSNTITSTVANTAYGISQLSSVLPGNAVTREFEVTSQIASAGPGLLWKIYSGFKKSTKESAAIFVFEKRQLERFLKKDRESVLETLRRGVAQLTKLRHPQILTVQHPLEESRDSLVFATEPVLGSLANVLGNHENIQSLPTTLKDFKLQEVEIRYGLLQLAEGLSFLHDDAKLLHRNLCPESIVLNASGAWKIFGLDFCVQGNQSTQGKPLWSFMELDFQVPQQNLNFQAPECVLASSCCPASDIFSLGMLIYVLHSPGHVPLYDCRNDLSKCRKFAENVSVVPKLHHMPEDLRDTVKLMLNQNPELRADAHQFVKIEYFSDIGVKTLSYLDKIFQWDNLQKSQFYKSLPQLLTHFPQRITLHRVLPALYKELVNPPMIPFVLPSIFYAMENCNKEEFTEHILPNIKPIFVLDDPPQISMVLIQRIELIVKLCAPEVIRADVVPLLLRALESELVQLQELGLHSLPYVVEMLEATTIKNAVLPRMKKICLDGKHSLGVRVNCLMCLADMMVDFDKWLVLDQVLPFLQQVPHCGEPAILMAIIGIYRMLLSRGKFAASKEVLATKVLPFLLPLCVEQSFNPSQYEILTSLVMEMVTRVTTEHKESLRQLDAVRMETQELSNIYQGEKSGKVGKMGVTPQKPVVAENGLTMEDKLRLMQQQEVHKKLQSQPPLRPQAVQQTIKPQPKDLTDTLFKSNLDQLNLSSWNHSNQMQTNMNRMQVNQVNWNANWKPQMPQTNQNFSQNQERTLMKENNSVNDNSLAAKEIMDLLN